MDSPVLNRPPAFSEVREIKRPGACKVDRQNRSPPDITRIMETHLKREPGLALVMRCFEDTNSFQRRTMNRRLSRPWFERVSIMG